MSPAFSGQSDRLPGSLSFRSINPSDQDFLRALYGSTRADELAQVDWDAAQKTAFIQMQFNAQHEHYQKHYSKAQFLIIEDRGHPIGRVYVDRRDDEIRLIDIALVAERRGEGLGTLLLKDLLDEAAAHRLPVRIHVEQFNPAFRWYQRLGFVLLEDKGVYQFMEWRRD